MTNSRRVAGLLLVILATAGTGCILRGPADLSRELSRSAGVELDAQLAFTLGRTGILLARMVTDGDEVPLRGVRRVQVGIYEVRGLGPHVEEQLSLQPPRLSGWHNVVRIQEDDEHVFVLLREEREQVRGLVVVVAEPDEWVIVRIRGRLQHVLEQTLEMAFGQADRPELYEPALAEYRRGGPSEEATATR